MISLFSVIACLTIFFVNPNNNIKIFGLNHLTFKKWYQPFTCNFIYKDFLHLIGDICLIICFMLPYEISYGSFQTFLLLFFSSYITNILEFKLNCKPFETFLGISGPMMMFGTFLLLTLSYNVLLSIIIFLTIFWIVSKKLSNIGHVAHLTGISLGFILYILKGV